MCISNDTKQICLDNGIICIHTEVANNSRNTQHWTLDDDAKQWYVMYIYNATTVQLFSYYAMCVSYFHVQKYLDSKFLYLIICIRKHVFKLK